MSNHARLGKANTQVTSGRFSAPEVQAVVKKMTNRQRQAWHRLDDPVDLTVLEKLITE